MSEGRPDACWDVVVVGGGMAGLSAAIYLARSRRRTIVIDSGHSMAKWEPLVENYLGFPDGISGSALLERSRAQAWRFGAERAEDEIGDLRLEEGGRFRVTGRSTYQGARVLLATGLTHLLPDIPGAKACLGHSLFFCKDCDAFRVQGRPVGVLGSRDETARYALAILAFSPSVIIATNGDTPTWDPVLEERLQEYHVPVIRERVTEILHDRGRIHALLWSSGRRLELEALFVTRGDVFHTGLAKGLGAREDRDGQLIVDADMRTTVPGLYAAGCVTPANCQMIIAAGQGATAAQAINRDLFEEHLTRHVLPRFSETAGLGARMA
jgi:thioredoxin reductase (NADPH)